MRKLFAMLLLILGTATIPTTSFAGDSYTCFMPHPSPEYNGFADEPRRPIFPVEYFVYNGTESSEAETKVTNTYHRLLSEHVAFFQAHPPRIRFFSDRIEFRDAFQDSIDHKGWRTAVVIGDVIFAEQLQHQGVAGVALVPSIYAVKPQDLEKIEAIAKMDYYSIAADHAFRRVTRMAAGLDGPELSVITSEHIISDALASR